MTPPDKAEKQARTATPWSYDLNHSIGRAENGEWMETVVQLPIGTHKRKPTDQEKADMRFIVEACNSHAGLVQENARAYESYTSLNHAYQELANAYDADRARIAELEAVLKPFAALSGLSSIKACDNDAEPFMTSAHNLTGIRQTILTVGDIRRAAQAYDAAVAANGGAKA